MDSLASTLDSLPASASRERGTGISGSRAALMAFVADPESESSLRECLSGLALSDASIVRGGIAAAIRHLAGMRSPNLLIVDMSGVDMPVSRVRELAEVCEPAVTVVALGEQNDVGLYRDLRQAGVSEYLVKPVTSQLFRRVLAPNPAADQPISHKLGKVVAVIGARGGVGATTLAANLAWYLAHRQNRRVVLVDFDLQNGDCGLALNVAPGAGLREVLTNPARIDRVFLERAMTKHGERLFVLSSEEPMSETLGFAPEAVATLLSALRNQFHYVIADVPRIHAPPYRLALDTADRRIIVADQTLRSVRDIARLSAVLGEDDPLRNLLAINRAGEGGRHAVTLKEIETFGTLRPKVVLPFQPGLFAAGTERGQVLAARHGRFAHAVGTLAFELSGRRPGRRRWWQSAA